MSLTFSINVGSSTEATRKPDIFSVLNDIQDNTQKLISPRDVRDAVLSTWANTPFKVTTPNSLSNYEYIGIDSSNHLITHSHNINNGSMMHTASFRDTSISLLSSPSDLHNLL